MEILPGLQHLGIMAVDRPNKAVFVTVKKSTVRCPFSYYVLGQTADQATVRVLRRARARRWEVVGELPAWRLDRESCVPKLPR